MKILAIDQSITASGWAVVEGGKIINHGVVRPPKFDESDPANLGRLEYSYKEFKKIIRNYRPGAMVLERYFPGTRGKRNGMTVVPELRGVLKVLAAFELLEFVEYAPQTVRCGLLGKGMGHADKEQVAGWVEKNFGIRPKPLDITDAISMAVYADREIRDEADKKIQAPTGGSRKKGGNRRTKGGNNASH